MKQIFLNNLKNVWGWKTPRKLIAIEVDDYGNVRLESRKARENLDAAGLKVFSRFDAFDALEDTEDLECLYDTLSMVRDRNGRCAVFTPVAVPCNIDFEAIAEGGYSQYCSEPLYATFEKMESRDPGSYLGAWGMWLEGIEKGLMAPEFHGREHINLRIFEEKLMHKNPELMVCFENRSYTSISDSGYSTISPYAAFDFWDFEENRCFEDVIRSGLSFFEEVFGSRASHYTPPAGGGHSVLHKALKDGGIGSVVLPRIQHEHQGGGISRLRFNWAGKKHPSGLICDVRNVVFEPGIDAGFDWVGYSLKQIETAFFWKTPAVISSHRVNYCGHISPENRETGITALGTLLKSIVSRWPDVEFVSARELPGIMNQK